MKLTDDELETQLNNITDFLKIIHPGLEGDRLALELRPLQRGTFNHNNNKSLNLWRYDTKSLTYLKQFLSKHNGEPNCLYYSVFRFDTDVKSITAAGKEAQAGKITTMSARLAETIVFDFDNIDESRRRELVIMFEESGLRLTWIFTGNGYHGLIHLSEVIRDNRLIKMLVNMFNNKGFNIDEHCVDTARVMRLPFTYNNKDPKNPIPTKLVEVSEERYSPDYLFSLLTFMPNEELIKDRGDLRLLSEYDLPKPIKQMLTFVPQGYRNSSLGFLVGFLKTNLGFGHEQLYTIMKEWAKEACSPIYPSVEFRRDFDRFFFSGALQYSSSLTAQFGYIDFNEFARLQKKHYLYLNTQIFDLAETPGELRVFLVIKLLEHSGDKGISIHDIVEWSEINFKFRRDGLTINAIRKDLKGGTRNKLLYKKNGHRKEGKPDLYYTNQLFNLSSGHYLLPANDADVFLSSLNLNQLKLYLYLSYLQSFGVQFISQQKLADDLDISRPRVSTLIKELEKLRFIRVDRDRVGKSVRLCTYTLLR